MPDASDKAALRASALARRDGLGPAVRAQASEAVARRASPLLPRPGGPLGGFWPIRSEIDPRPLMRLAAGAGHPLALPRVTKEGLVFHAWDPDVPLVGGKFGLSEPAPDAPVVDPSALIVPLAAFDRRGHRIGYGAGYYDRAIERLSAGGRPLATIGVAFAVQEIDRVPDASHDRALDWIVTEAEVIRCGSPEGSR
jgi:5-formyltetrahydrofolate cyclo-ligase